MPGLKIEKLNIIVKEENDVILIDWEGFCDLKDPGQILTEFFFKIFSSYIGKKIEMSFEKLLYINSSSISPIISILRKLNELQISSKIVYDKSVFWQEISFKSFIAITAKLDYVTIKEKDEL